MKWRTWAVRLLVWIAIVSAVFSCRFGLLLFVSDEGEAGFWAGLLALLILTYWVCAPISRRHALLGALVGAAGGWLYLQLEWQFDRVVLVDILGRFNEESIRWLATGLTLVQWPVILACALVGAASAWHKGAPEQSPRAH